MTASAAENGWTVVVGVKQVPDSGEVGIDPDTGSRGTDLGKSPSESVRSMLGTGDRIGVADRGTSGWSR